MKYQLIVFDWDGTLLDSGGYIVDCVKRAARDAQLGELQESLARQVIGLNYEMALNTLLPNATQKQKDLFTYYYRNHIELGEQKPKLYSGAEKVLKTLSESNYLLAIATGKSRYDWQDDIKRLAINSFFAATRCGDETFSKPHPQMLLEIMEETGISPQQTLMIGDTEYDLELAKNAGVDALAATYGLRKKESLLPYPMIGYISDIKELLKWLTN